MQEEAALALAELARQEGGVERLAVDAEAVLAEPQHRGAVFEDLAAVAQDAGRLLAQGFDPAVELVGLDRAAQLAQLAGELAQLGDHRVGHEVGGQLLLGGEAAARRPMPSSTRSAACLSRPVRRCRSSTSTCFRAVKAS